jgi:uncharacterized membrane protein (Fun14 family)
LTLSLFSKPLTLLLGLLFLGAQALEYNGIHIIPYNRIQRLFTNASSVDVKTAVQDNAALKVTFAVSMLLSGFVSF